MPLSYRGEAYWRVFMSRLFKAFVYRGIPAFIILYVCSIPRELYFNISMMGIVLAASLITISSYFFDTYLDK